MSGWSYRLLQEYKRARTAFFVTLTYNTDNVPITQKGFMSLQKKDLQKYFKRLRKLNHEGIKYFACGEYGTKKKRPHYHLILFNAEEFTIPMAWTIEGRSIGDLHFGDVNGASIGYTLKYMNKETKIPMFKGDDREPEFQLMSKGLGSNYLTKNKIHWHKNDLLNRYYVPLEDGKKIALPRYYKKKIYSEDEIQYIGKQFSTIVESEEWKKEQELGDKYYKQQKDVLEAKLRSIKKSRIKENENL